MQRSIYEQASDLSHAWARGLHCDRTAVQGNQARMGDEPEMTTGVQQLAATRKSPAVAPPQIARWN